MAPSKTRRELKKEAEALKSLSLKRQRNALRNMTPSQRAEVVSVMSEADKNATLRCLSMEDRASTLAAEEIWVMPAGSSKWQRMPRLLDAAGLLRCY